VVVESIYLDPTAGAGELALASTASAAGTRVFDLEPGVLARVSGTVTPQPIAAIVPFVDVALADLRSPSMVVVCVDVRDPGNAGTILRSAAAAGADAVVVCDGSVDVTNPKTVRASAGAVFHVPVVVAGTPLDALGALGDLGLRRLAAVARDGEDYTAAELWRPTALVLGNEATGLPDGLGSVLDGGITIPMPGRAESLNVGMAAAVLCFEAARQRRTGAPQVPAATVVAGG
jgi:TrmH family RNA methyltransferase